MAIERTLSIIKPDALAKNAIGEIIARFEKKGHRVVAAKMIHSIESRRYLVGIALTLKSLQKLKSAL